MVRGVDQDLADTLCLAERADWAPATRCGVTRGEPSPSDRAVEFVVGWSRAVLEESPEDGPEFDEVHQVFLPAGRMSADSEDAPKDRCIAKRSAAHWELSRQSATEPFWNGLWHVARLARMSPEDRRKRIPFRRRPRRPMPLLGRRTAAATGRFAPSATLEPRTVCVSLCNYCPRAWS